MILPIEDMNVPIAGDNRAAQPFACGVAAQKIVRRALAHRIKEAA